jgi:hypothetical protein
MDGYGCDFLPVVESVSDLSQDGYGYGYFFYLREYLKLSYVSIFSLA